MSFDSWHGLGRKRDARLVSARPSARAEAMQMPTPAFDEEMPTLAYRREELLAPWSPAQAEVAAHEPPRPIPNFRPAFILPPPLPTGSRHAPTVVLRVRKASRLPWMAWTAASLLAAMLSYRATPIAIERVDAAVHGLRSAP